MWLSTGDFSRASVQRAIFRNSNFQKRQGQRGGGWCGKSKRASSNLPIFFCWLLGYVGRRTPFSQLNKRVKEAIAATPNDVIHHQNVKQSNDLRVDSFEFTRTRTDSCAYQADVFAEDSVCVVSRSNNLSMLSARCARLWTLQTLTLL